MRAERRRLELTAAAGLLCASLARGQAAAPPAKDPTAPPPADRSYDSRAKLITPQQAALQDAEKRLRQLIEAAEKEVPGSPPIQALRQVLADVQAGGSTADPKPIGSGTGATVGNATGRSAAQAAADEVEALRARIAATQEQLTNLSTQLAEAEQRTAAAQAEAVRKRIEAAKRRQRELAAERKAERGKARTDQLKRLQETGYAVPGPVGTPPATGSPADKGLAEKLDRIIERLDRIEKRLEGLEKARPPQGRISGQGHRDGPVFNRLPSR